MVDVFAVDGDGALLDFVEAVEEVYDCGFSGAGGAYDGDGFAGFDLEVYSFYYGFVVDVAEMDVVELDVSLEGWGFVGAVVLDLVLGVEDFEDAVGGDHAHLHFVEFVGDLSEGVEEHADVHGVGEDVSEGCGGVASEDSGSGVPDDEAEGQGGEDVGDGEEYGVVPDGFYPGFSVLVVDLGEFVGFGVFAVEKLYDFHSGYAFLNEGVEVCDLVSDFFEGDLHFSLEDAGDE